MPRFQKLRVLIQHLLKRYRSSHAEAWAASISFYTMLALPALFTVLFSGVRSFISQEELQLLFASFLPQAIFAGSLQDFIAASYEKPLALPLLFSLLIALFSAGKIFSHLTIALGEIWHFSPLVLPKKTKTTLIARVATFAQRRLSDILPLFILVCSLVVLILAHTVFHILLPLLTPLFPEVSLFLPLLSSLLFLSISGGVCALFFRIFSKKKFDARQCGLGGFMTAFLLFLGQLALGLYFRLVDVGDGFGALGSAVALLLWLYYSASIFLFGATLVCNIAPHTPR
jgi:membrane protein